MYLHLYLSIVWVCLCVCVCVFGVLVVSTGLGFRVHGVRRRLQGVGLGGKFCGVGSMIWNVHPAPYTLHPTSELAQIPYANPPGADAGNAE